MIAIPEDFRVGTKLLIKIYHEAVPFLLSSQLLLIPSFDIYHVKNTSDVATIPVEDELRLRKLFIAGKGTLR